MLHFSCDVCGRHLGEERYVVKVETYPAFDPEEIDEADLDADHLEEISATIEAMEAAGQFELEECGSKTFRYDLCPACHRRYVKDPLGRESLRRVDFSKN